LFCDAELVSASHVKGCDCARGILKQVQDDKQVQDKKICHAELVSASHQEGCRHARGILKQVQDDK